MRVIKKKNEKREKSLYVGFAVDAEGDVIGDKAGEEVHAKTPRALRRLGCQVTRISVD
jgi:DNA topoisomerase IA